MNRIAFITDLHLVQDRLANQIDTKSNFLKIAETLESWKLDHIVCGGDLSYKEPYLKDAIFVKAILEKIGVSYDVICGNHDTAEDLASTFGYPIQQNEIYFHKVIGGRPCIFLDSNRGSISDQQCTWLKAKLKQSVSPLIFMHYPPFETGISFMDNNHQFKDKDKLLDILFSYEKTLSIFCGHCHAERLIQYKNLDVHITPSCFMQFDARAKDFQIYHKYPGYRIIEYDQGEILRTFINYLF